MCAELVIAARLSTIGYGPTMLKRLWFIDNSNDRSGPIGRMPALLGPFASQY